jgi:hypothetical protein
MVYGNQGIGFSFLHIIGLACLPNYLDLGSGDMFLHLVTVLLIAVTPCLSIVHLILFLLVVAQMNSIVASIFSTSKPNFYFVGWTNLRNTFPNQKKPPSPGSLL